MTLLKKFANNIKNMLSDGVLLSTQILCQVQGKAGYRNVGLELLKIALLMLWHFLNAVRADWRFLLFWRLECGEVNTALSFSGDALIWRDA